MSTTSDIRTAWHAAAGQIRDDPRNDALAEWALTYGLELAEVADATAEVLALDVRSARAVGAGARVHAAVAALDRCVCACGARMGVRVCLAGCDPREARS